MGVLSALADTPGHWSLKVTTGPPSVKPAVPQPVGGKSAPGGGWKPQEAAWRIPRATAAPAASLPVWLALTLLTLTALFWGGGTVAARAAAGDIPLFSLTFWRWTIAFVLFIPLGFRPWFCQRALFVATGRW